jgi:hypothetical protein
MEETAFVRKFKKSGLDEILLRLTALEEGFNNLVNDSDE